jgi:hypothetical protein
MEKTFIPLLAGALAIALVAAGCGGGSGSSTASISKAEFEKQGNAICAQGEKRIQQEARKYAKEHHLQQKPTTAQFTEIAETIVIPGIQQQLDELRALGAPAGEESQVKETFAAVEEGLEEIKKEPAKVIQPEGSIPAFAKANKMARGLGLETCGEE